MKSSILLAAFVASTLASAANASDISLLTPIVIDPASKISDSVRAECRINYQLESSVLEAMRHYDKSAGSTKVATSGHVLKLTITYVLGVGGGAWTGPKVIAVRADLLNDGNVEYTTKMHRRSGLGGPFKGTCELLDGASKGLGKMVAKWVQHPTSSSDVGDPEIPAASEAASGAEQ